MVRIGVVVLFDERAGLGVVRDDSGSEFPFHATRIRGGSRTIARDTPVAFTVGAAQHGRWEAVAVRSL